MFVWGGREYVQRNNYFENFVKTWIPWWTLCWIKLKVSEFNFFWSKISLFPNTFLLHETWTSIQHSQLFNDQTSNLHISIIGYFQEQQQQRNWIQSGGVKNPLTFFFFSLHHHHSLLCVASIDQLCNSTAAVPARINSFALTAALFPSTVGAMEFPLFLSLNDKIRAQLYRYRLSV